MKLTGLHFMLTWQCNLECDHCFVWGSPRQSGTWKLADIRTALDRGRALGTVEWIYFEGGEPFLYYPVLLQSVAEAAGRGFKVGIVTNGYWATEIEDARAWLRPFAGLIEDLSISSDLYHCNESLSRQARIASTAARELGIPVGLIEVAQPQTEEGAKAGDTDGPAASTLMYRGRAAVNLAGRAPQLPWQQFSGCPYEDLEDPGRVHVDPFGNLHICQGIILGNILQQPLSEICAAYRADTHPVIGPLLHGGPAELVRRYHVPHKPAYADACHLCYFARLALRERFPVILGPDGMYAG